MTSRENIPFSKMTTREKRSLVLSLREQRETLKRNSRQKPKARKTAKKKPSVSFDNPVLQALFDKNSDKMKKVLGIR